MWPIASQRRKGSSLVFSELLHEAVTGSLAVVRVDPSDRTRFVEIAIGKHHFFTKPALVGLSKPQLGVVREPTGRQRLRGTK
jgi:hypothetical protein